jgi:hypothetical protein
MDNILIESENKVIKLDETVTNCRNEKTKRLTMSELNQTRNEIRELEEENYYGKLNFNN